MPTHLTPKMSGSGLSHFVNNIKIDMPSGWQRILMQPPCRYTHHPASHSASLHFCWNLLAWFPLDGLRTGSSSKHGRGQTGRNMKEYYTTWRSSTKWQPKHLKPRYTYATLAQAKCWEEFLGGHPNLIRKKHNTIYIYIRLMAKLLGFDSACIGLHMFGYVWMCFFLWEVRSQHFVQKNRDPIV